MTLKIESTSNNVFKNIKKLASHSGRKKAGQFVIEGYRSVKDAILNNAPVVFAAIAESAPQSEREFFDGLKNVKKYIFADKLFAELKFTVNSQGILAVAEYKEKNTNEMFEDTDGTIKCRYKNLVYLDNVRDPGNMGTVIRTCDAFACGAVILSEGCADIYSPKVIRSTMSSIFNIPVFFDSDPNNTFAMLKKCGYEVYGTFLSANKYICDIPIDEKSVLVMGNEANGISEQIEKLCTQKIKIPMSGRAESLNVATACSVAVYERFIREFKKDGI